MLNFGWLYLLIPTKNVFKRPLQKCSTYKILFFRSKITIFRKLEKKKAPNFVNSTTRDTKIDTARHLDFGKIEIKFVFHSTDFGPAEFVIACFDNTLKCLHQQNMGYFQYTRLKSCQNCY